MNSKYAMLSVIVAYIPRDNADEQDTDHFYSAP